MLTTNSRVALARSTLVTLITLAIVGCSGDTPTSRSGSASSGDRQTPTTDAVAIPPVSTTAKAETSRTVGFRDKEELFECYPGDEVTFEEADGEKAMRWVITYVENQHRACVKDVSAGIASGMTFIHFKVRSDSSSHLWVQVNEAKSGSSRSLTSSSRRRYGSSSGKP